MVPVLMLFLLPVGGGIPAGVLLAHAKGLAWPMTTGLYFVSDVILALAFEPVLRLLVAWGRKVPALARVTAAMKPPWPGAWPISAAPERARSPWS